MIFIFDYVHLFFHFSISFPIILFPKHCFNVDSPISNTFSHLKHGASHNLLILDRKNIQCQFVPSIFICVQPNVVTTDNSRAIMLMYYGRLFIKMACYLFEKKNSLQNRQVHRRKNVPCNTFHSKRYILYLLKLSFLKKKKKLLTTRRPILILCIFLNIIHARRSSSSATNKKEKRKKRGKEKNFAWERLVCGLFKDGCRPSQLTTECRYTQLASLTALRGQHTSEARSKARWKNLRSNAVLNIYTFRREVMEIRS